MPFIKRRSAEYFKYTESSDFTEKQSAVFGVSKTIPDIRIPVSEHKYIEIISPSLTYFPSNDKEFSSSRSKSRCACIATGFPISLLPRHVLYC